MTMDIFFKTPIRVALTVFVAVLCVSFALKSVGFHIQGFTLVRGGDIVITSPDTPHRVFLDDRNITRDGEDMRIENVSPGPHSIVVYSDTDWPWSKRDLRVESGTTLSLTPFLIPKNTSGFIITSEDPEYDSLRQRIIDTAQPNEDTPLLSANGLVAVWIEENTVYARFTQGTSTLPQYFCNGDGVCTETISVFSSPSEIRDVEFYKDYDNIVMIASQNQVFAIELDRRGDIQNFQPIYTGASLPRFAKIDAQSIVVSDGSVLFLINL